MPRFDRIVLVFERHRAAPDGTSSLCSREIRRSLCLEEVDRFVKTCSCAYCARFGEGCLFIFVRLVSPSTARVSVTSPLKLWDVWCSVVCYVGAGAVDGRE
jgi:hypothetical protein